MCSFKQKFIKTALTNFITNYSTLFNVFESSEQNFNRVTRKLIGVPYSFLFHLNCLSLTNYFKNLFLRNLFP